MCVGRREVVGVPGVPGEERDRGELGGRHRWWEALRVTSERALSVWDRLREYAETQTGAFTSQEAISWFRRHVPGQATDSTIRVHTRGASWNVDNRSQFAGREPFLTRVGHGTFRRMTP